jgi:hypothetical protein
MSWHARKRRRSATDALHYRRAGGTGAARGVGRDAGCARIYRPVSALAALIEDHGWSATVTDMAVPGNKWKRWAHRPIPANVPNAPRGYFVEAVKA